ncbi:MAG: Xaa-Pro peptidase family protein [Desulfobacterota bacterium]|nr:Xaa-Pro peptidase family protein [Thermodesulfobacteriota bacterium]
METVPPSEIESRILRFQKALAEKGLDGAFVLQNVDRYYFSGTIQTSVLFIPREGEPALMVQKGFERARRESPLKDVLPVVGRGQIKKRLKERGWLRLKRIGLEMDVLPINLFFRYQQTYPEYEWVDVSEAILRLRMIKSPYEVEQLRRAAAILHKGYLEIGGILREGMTELEVDGHLALIARREGHMGVMRMRGWNQEMTHAHVLAGETGAAVSFLDSPHGGMGNTPAMAQGASFRRIGRNEPIGIDYGVGVNGYIADQFRTFVIGELPDDLRMAHDLSLEIHALFVEKARPGIPCSELYRFLLERVKRSAFEGYFNGYGEGKVRFIGHGLGLEIDEYPILSPRFNQTLEPGMVIALEPMFVFPDRGIVGLEDDYLITPSGAERLTLTDQVLLMVETRP